MSPLAPSTRNALGLAAVLAICAAVYWHALGGPFLFDDGWVLQPVEEWKRGESSWQEALLGNQPLLLSRLVAMATFLFSASLGPGPFPFKLVNLALHLLCGLLVWAVTLRVARLDARLQSRAHWVALFATAFWLLHPLQVSTVLYVVQRMAQLSMLFSMLAIWVYLIARNQAAQGRTLAAALNLFLAFPVLVILGLLSKQNAAATPLLCLVIELAYFRPAPGKRLMSLFFGFSVALPGLLVTVALALFPQRLQAAYADWTFTLGQRLLTQPHVLMDYLSMLLIPRAPRMGLYTDDFPISTGLLSPPATLISIFALVAISVAALTLRRRAPIVFAGWFFFLAAHSVESTFLPLEMYYEHRNYLPSVGVLWMLVGGFASLPALGTNVLSPRQLGMAAGGLFAAMLAFATFGRTLVWESKETIVAQGLAHHPRSIRAAFDASSQALRQQDYAAAERVTAGLLSGDNAQYRAMARLHLAAIACMRAGDADPSLLSAARADTLDRLTVFETQAIKLLLEVQAEQGDRGCGRLTPALIADHISYMLAKAPAQPETSINKWQSRFYLAQMQLRAGRWDLAEEQTKIAWENSGDKPIGAFLTRLHMRQGHIAQAQAVYRELARAMPSHSPRGQAELQSIRQDFQKIGHPIP